jgi:hypothetical protein
LIGLGFPLNEIVDEADGLFQIVGKGSDFCGFSSAEVLQRNAVCDVNGFFLVCIAGGDTIDDPIDTVDFHVRDHLFRMTGMMGMVDFHTLFSFYKNGRQMKKQMLLSA